MNRNRAGQRALFCLFSEDTELAPPGCGRPPPPCLAGGAGGALPCWGTHVRFPGRWQPTAMLGCHQGALGRELARKGSSCLLCTPTRCISPMGLCWLRALKVRRKHCKQLTSTFLRLWCTSLLRWKEMVTTAYYLPILVCLGRHFAASALKVSCSKEKDADLKIQVKMVNT